MDSWMKDVRYALRRLARSPTFTTIAVATIALGIGASSAIFSVVRSVLLAPLPYDEPKELVMVWGEMRNRGVGDFPTAPSVLDEMRRQSRRFQGFAGVTSFQAPLVTDGEPVQLDVGAVTSNFFSLLGAVPIVGRDFRAEDAFPLEVTGDSPFRQAMTSPTVTILSHPFWQQHFGADPGVVGTSLDLGGNFVEVVGVLPAGFRVVLPEAAGVPVEVAVWVAPRIDAGSWNPLNVVWSVVGRLEPGVTLRSAQSDMDAVARRVREEIQVYNTAGFALEVVPMDADITEEVRPIVLALMVAVGLLLLIACANVANLLLVRAAARERELAIRAAMGGSRARLIRQMLVESLVLAGLGGALGLVVAGAGIHGLLRLTPDGLPRVAEVGIDGTVLAFTALASFAAAALFGLVPALRGTRLELAHSLRDRGHAASARFVSGAVVVAEVALSVVLLVGAGLMVRSFLELQRIDPGFDAEGVLTFEAPLPLARYSESGSRHRFAVQFQERLAGLPGVESATAVFPLPLDGPALSGRYGTEEAEADDSYFRQGAYKVVLPGYFETVATPVLEGRVFTAADNADSARVVVVDERLAELTWPAESAVGKRLLVRFLTPEPQWVEVIGVVRHQRHTGLGAPSREVLFLTERYAGTTGDLKWTVRTGGDPLALLPAVRRELGALDPAIPLSEPRPFGAFVADAMAPTRFAMTLIGVFGLAALALATVGLYGVLSSIVRQRVPEIGVRMALGAHPSRVWMMVVGQGLRLGGAGLALGLVVAFAAAGAMENLLVGIAPQDPVTFVAITGVFLVVVALSCFVPARAATRVDPKLALLDP